jgi:hypothetical protein
VEASIQEAPRERVETLAPGESVLVVADTGEMEVTVTAFAYALFTGRAEPGAGRVSVDLDEANCGGDEQRCPSQRAPACRIRVRIGTRSHLASTTFRGHEQL